MSTSPPVVLVLVKGLGIGGAETLISGGAKHWDTDRFSYHVAYVLPWKDNLVRDLVEAGVEVTCVGGEKGMDPLTHTRLRRLVRDLKVSLIHAHLPSTGIIARSIPGVPTVYTEHNLADSYRLPTRLLNYLTYGRNAAVTAVSSAVSHSLRGYPGPHPIVVENGVDPDQLPVASRSLRDELGMSDESQMVVHVGNIRPHKGHDTLIDAAEIIARTRKDISIISIGGEKTSGDLARLDSKVCRLGLDHVIRFLGRRPDASRFVAAADVYVNPSDVEGLPVSILEAMALGKPVIATAVGGVPSLITDGESGRLVKPSDPGALAEAILEVLDSDDGGETLGRRGRHVVLQRHGIASMIRGFEDIYARVLAERV